MISFKLFKQEELKELLECFDNTFLQVPFKHPTKTLQKFIPKGFRSDKLCRTQKINVFCDAILSVDPNITSLIIKEIELIYEKLAISEIMSKIYNEEVNIYNKLCDISINIWKYNIYMPAHIVLLLNEFDCDESIKQISRQLMEAHFTELNQVSLNRYEQGKKEIEKKLEHMHNEYKSVIERLNIKVEESKAFSKNIEENYRVKNDEKKQLEKQNELLQLQLNIQQNKLAESQNQVLTMKNEMHILASDNAIKLESLDDVSRSLEKMIKSYEILNNEAKELKNDLEIALKMSISEHIIKKLCLEVLDELRSPSPHQKEIIDIAKKRLSPEIEIDKAWSLISEDSNMLIHNLCVDFENKIFSERQLDELEDMENGILIQYATLKAFKSYLFYALESKNFNTSISEEFK